MTKKKLFTKRNIIIASVGGVVLIGVIAAIIASSKPKELKVGKIERGTVVQEVSSSGKVVPAENIELAFEKSGRIIGVYAKVGAKVSKGARLVELENGDLKAQLAQAQANVRAAEARLAKLEAGTRPEEIRIKETEVAKARQDLDNLYGEVKDIVNEAYSDADDAVRSKISDLFVNPDASNVRLSFQTTNSQAEIDTLSLRVKIGKELADWRSELSRLSYSAPQDELAKALDSARVRAGIVNDLLTRSLDAVEGSQTLPEATKTTYKTNISSARTNVNGSRASLTTQIQSISSQKSTVTRIENELALARAGSTKAELDAERANVDEARASAAYASAQLEKTILRAPFAGTVTKSEKSAGDIVAANEGIISLIGMGKFQVEVNIAESDITRVKIGNPARVTFDTYGTENVFDATVVKVDLSETEIDNVATYKTVLEFTKSDDRIISGLTANVVIENEKRENVLYAFTRNVSTRDGKSFVKRLTNAETFETEDVEVKTGLRGSDGRTEIISGIAEGEEIVIQ